MKGKREEAVPQQNAAPEKSKKNGPVAMIRKGLEQINVRPIPTIVILSVLITLINELLTRRSLGGTFGFVIHHPWMFLLNVWMVFATLTIPLVFRRRMTGVLLISLLWLILGICNYIVLSYRITPFSLASLSLSNSLYDYLVLTCVTPKVTVSPFKFHSFVKPLMVPISMVTASVSSLIESAFLLIISAIFSLFAT